MPQPKRNGVKTVIKNKTKLVNTKQPNRVNGEKTEKTKKKRVWQQKPKIKHQEYGTSKLETRFAENFLDKLGVKYIYQYKMESIGRFLDFYLPEENIAIEIDGDYYHSYGLLYEEMSPMQKHNARVDKQKNHWCHINCIKLIRIWEHDINKNPSKVMGMLKEEFHTSREQENKKKMKRQRHYGSKFDDTCL